MREVNVMDNVKALTEPGLKKLFGIIKDEIKNNSQGGTGGGIESQLSEYFYSKQEILDILRGSGGAGGAIEWDEKTPGFNSDMVWKNVDTGIESSCIKVLRENGKFIAVFQYNYIVILDENNPTEVESIICIRDIINSGNPIEIRDMIFAENSYYISGWDGMNNIGYILHTTDLSSYSKIIINNALALYGVWPNGDQIYFYCEDSYRYSSSTMDRCFSLYSVMDTEVNTTIECSVSSINNTATIKPTNCNQLKIYDKFNCNITSNITPYTEIRNFFIIDGCLFVSGSFRTSASSSYVYAGILICNLLNDVYKNLWMGSNRPNLDMVNAFSVNGSMYLITYWIDSSLFRYELYQYNKTSSMFNRIYPAGSTYEIYNNVELAKDPKIINLNCTIALSGKYMIFSGGNACFAPSLEYFIDHLSEIKSFRVSTNMILSVVHNYKYIVAGGENGNLIVAAIS